jgi:hypothetical protein
MSHSDICNTSYGRKNGRELNWQFDSRPLKVRNRPNPDVCRWSATHRWKSLEDTTSLLQISSQSEVSARSYELAKSPKVPGVQIRKFWDSSLGVRGQKAIRMWVPRANTKNNIWGKVEASPKSRPWWVFWVQSCPWLILAPRVF